MIRTHMVALALALAVPLACHAAQSVPTGERARARAILEQMIDTNTTSGQGTTGLVKALAKRFLQAGFLPADVQMVGSDPKRLDLVVRLRGRGERAPILLMGHLDVVNVQRQDWHTDPFKLTERGGYYYGRGTMDIKGADAGLIATLLRFHREGFKPKGDYILALTAGEEDGVSNGIQWLLAHRPELIHSQYSINVDGGGPEIRDGRVAVVAVETAEKAYASYTLTAHGPGGHSAIPKGHNPIFRLAAGLKRLSGFEFPLQTNATTRRYFSRLAALNTGETAADMRAVAQQPTDTAAMQRLASHSAEYNAVLRTTCVPTLLTGGIAENALPQQVSATINCRIMPGVPPKQVQTKIEQVLDDPGITVVPVAPAPTSPPSPINDALFAGMAQAAKQTWGYSIPVTAYMSAGASDSVFLRAAGMNSYVFNGIAYDVDDDRSHAPNERILVKSFYQSLEFDYRLLKQM